MRALSIPSLALAASLAVALPLGAEVVEGEMIGTWKATCEDGPCRVFLKLEKDGTEVVGWQLLADRNSKVASMILTAPLGTALPPGLRVMVDASTRFDVAAAAQSARGRASYIELNRHGGAPPTSS